MFVMLDKLTDKEILETTSPIHIVLMSVKYGSDTTLAKLLLCLRRSQGKIYTQEPVPAIYTTYCNTISSTIEHEITKH